MLYILIICGLSCWASNVEETLPNDAAFSRIKSAIERSRSPYETLEYAVSRYMMGGWECPLLLAIDAADVSEKTLQSPASRLRVFVRHCQGAFLAKARASLGVFQPVAKPIQNINTPACNAVKAVYQKVQQLSLLPEFRKEAAKTWSRLSDIRKTSKLIAALGKVDRAAHENVKAFTFPGEVSGCSMDDVWADIVMLGAWPTPTLDEFIAIVNFLEGRGTDPQRLAKYCVDLAGNFCDDKKIGSVLEKISKGSVAYKFLSGKGVDHFSGLLHNVHGKRHAQKQVMGALEETTPL